MQPLVMEQNVFEYKDLSDLGAFWQSRKIRLRHKEQNDWLELSNQVKESFEVKLWSTKSTQRYTENYELV